MAHKKSILLVDDDMDFVEANRIALEASGYVVLTACDCRAGIERTLEDAPDLIVLDLMMEHMDSGFSLLEEIATQPNTRSIPVVMVSGLAAETGLQFDQEAIPPGWPRVVEFINKPVDPVELTRKLASILAEPEC